MQNYSVLMSVYKNDDEKYLELAIESMINQTVQPEQYVIVIDGPIPPSLLSVILKFEKNYPTLFTILKLSQNQGLGSALNAGIELCRNELIARMDADDISKIDRCEKQLKQFEKNPSLEILGTQIEEFVDEIENVISQREVPCSKDRIKSFAKRRSPFNHPTVMYKKDTICKLGKYRAYGRKEDLDLFLRGVFSNCICENLSESLLWYRTSNENLKRRKTWINCKEYIDVMYGFYKENNVSLTDLIYVVVGQLSMYVLPVKLTNMLSSKLLRKKMKVSNR